jgi:RNA polymerase sigma-70 factor (ECF subfamily)
MGARGRIIGFERSSVIDDDPPENVEDGEEMRPSALRPVSPGRPDMEAVTPAVPESDLVERARTGDTDAFADLVRRRSPGVIAFLRRMLGETEDARDVAQLTFVRVWENLDRYDASWAFSTWLYRIASNLAIDALRSRRSRARTEAENLRLVAGGPLVAESGGPARLSRGEVRRIFEACSAVLSEKQRLVFVLREFEEKESREIATILDCRESTVRNHLFQARRLLRGELLRRFPEFARGYGGTG